MSTDVAAVPPIIRHPYRFVAALEGLVLVVYLAAGTVAQVVRLPGLWLYAAANIALTLVVAVILTVMGRWRSIGFRAPRRRRDLLYFLVPFLPVILNVAPGLQFTGAAEVTGLVLLALMCIPSTVRASAGWTRGRSLERRYSGLEGFSTEL